MKKILCISLAVLYVIALSACVDRQQAASSTSAEPEASVSAAGPGTADTQTSSNSIIAESSNTVSDKEVESILDDLSAELDKAFSDAQNLEDLDDTDLDVNNIN